MARFQYAIQTKFRQVLGRQDPIANITLPPIVTPELLDDVLVDVDRRLVARNEIIEKATERQVSVGSFITIRSEPPVSPLKVPSIRETSNQEDVIVSGEIVSSLRQYHFRHIADRLEGQFRASTTQPKFTITTKMPLSTRTFSKCVG